MPSLLKVVILVIHFPIWFVQGASMVGPVGATFVNDRHQLLVIVWIAKFGHDSFEGILVAYERKTAC